MSSNLCISKASMACSLYVQELQAAKHMHILCCVGVEAEPDMQYSCTYVSALHSSLSATGSRSPAATFLHMKYMAEPELDAFQVLISGASVALMGLLPQLQSMCISSEDGLVCYEERDVIQCSGACPQLSARQLSTGSMSTHGSDACRHMVVMHVDTW